MKTLVALLAVCVVAVPIAAVLTFLLVPFWGWFEARTGIESLGHSGPADWCFAVVYGLVAAVILVAWGRSRKRGSA